MLQHEENLTKGQSAIQPCIGINPVPLVHLGLGLGLRLGLGLVGVVDPILDKVRSSEVYL